MFIDIGGSTEAAAGMVIAGWVTWSSDTHSTVRSLLARYRGNEVDTAGDGFFATSDGPSRAVRCASAIIGRFGDWA